uniref:Uncharacterized protein n=1 Tax=Cyanothece sp. (strain PCC 7425 / ATCC 29141) TaxID=395961 RepID=B8HSN7_CYAP4
MAFTPPYQSKVLTFLLRQSRQLRDRLGQTLQQTRGAIAWGMQVTLFSLFQLLQTSQLGNKTLRQGVAWSWRKLQSEPAANRAAKILPATDTVVERVLQSIRVRPAVDQSSTVSSSESVSPVAVSLIPIGGETHQQSFLQKLLQQHWQFVQRVRASFPLSAPAKSPVLPGSGNAQTPGVASDTISLASPSLLPGALPTESPPPLLRWQPPLLRWQDFVRQSWHSLNHWGQLALTQVTPAQTSALTQAGESQVAERSLADGTLPEQNQRGNGLSIQAMVQGIATLLQPRRLVLVTNTNQILDILTPAQQRQLQWRIVWELATYYRQVRIIRQLTGAPIPLPQWCSEKQPSEPMLRSPQPSMPLPKAPNWRSPMTDWKSSLGFAQMAPQTTAPLETPQVAVPALTGNFWSHLASRLQNALQNRLSQIWSGLSTPALPLQPRASGSPTELVPVVKTTSQVTPAPKVGATVAIKPEKAVTAPVSASAGRQSQSSIANPLTGGGLGVTVAFNEAIEAEAIFVSYEKHPLEQILTWLDRVMVWIEAMALYLWQHLRGNRFLQAVQQRLKQGLGGKS